MSILQVIKGLADERGRNVARGVVNACILGALPVPLPRELFIDLTQQTDRDVGEIEMTPVKLRRVEVEPPLVVITAGGFFTLQNAFKVMKQLLPCGLPFRVEELRAATIRQRQEVAVEGLVQPPARGCRVFGIIRAM